MTIDKQALRQLATDAHELGIIKRYTKGIEANKRFIAAFNPATVLALLDELEKDNCSNVHYADAAEMEIAALRQRIAELQMARDKCFLSGLKTGWEYGIADDTEGYNREIADAQAVIDRAAGIGVKGE
ncbi:ead/Ea22-like family protein [Escherichia coli]|uniref:Ead/Ea22-like family protein n=1 Tax=Escherichia coli TaxID=562 RepID=A0A8T6QI44_ECOLX|nr:ead/Ea22-like family protein [Escherichia coli]